MADNTGAPWLLPYPEDTDLVRDGASDIEALAVAVASGLTVASTGIGTNVVTAVRTDTQSSAVAEGAVVAVTSLSCSITPTSATSKVLVFAEINVATSAGPEGVNVILKRNNTAIGLGDAASARTRVTSGGGGAAGRTITPTTIVLLDSPNLATAVAYTVELHNCSGGAANLFLNRSSADNDSAIAGRAASRITAVEVAA